MIIKGVFFDLVGTLLIYGDMVSELSEWHSEFYMCLRKHGLSISRENFIERCDEIMIFGNEPPRPKDGLTIFERRIQALCSDLKIEVRIREIKDIAVRLVDVWREYLLPDPDSILVLETLQQDKTLALVSNFDHPPFVYDAVHTSGLEKFFETVVVSGDVGFKKPDPRIFHLALQRTGLQPEEVVYVGDTDEDI